MPRSSFPPCPDWSCAPLFGRRETILRTLQLLWRRQPGPVNIVETGTTRSAAGLLGDGWSTVAWAWYVRQVGGRVWTVDIDPAAHEACRQIVARYAEVVDHVVADSVAFLSDWVATSHRSVDLLYLDSLDFDDRNLSTQHCLAEVEAIRPALSTEALVLFDDTESNGDRTVASWHGKGELAVPALVVAGFEVVFSCARQTLLQRRGSAPAEVPRSQQ